MKKMKRLSALLLTMVMSASLAMPAFAATKTDISSVDIHVSSTIEAGADEWEVEVTTPTSHVSIDEEDIKVTNAPDEGVAWGDAVKPSVTVVIRIEDDDEYRFKTGFKKNDVNVTGDEATVTSVSRSSSKLTVKFTLPKLVYEEGYWDERLSLDGVEWEEGSGVAHWEENEDAASYELKVYRGSTSLAGVIKTSDTSYDLSQHFTRKGTYSFKVRGVHDSKNKGEWMESDELDLDAEEAEEIYNNGGTTTSSSNNTSTSTNKGSGEGAWLRDNVGWWWCNADRTYPSSTWKLINNKWYYFNASGYCVQNQWVQTNNLWYYCGPDGDMWVNRMTPDNYWVNADGVWVK